MLSAADVHSTRSPTAGHATLGQMTLACALMIATGFAGLAYQILQAGFQLNIPRMFAALLLISLTGVALFVLMAWLTKLALGSWHASELSQD